MRSSWGYTRRPSCRTSAKVCHKLWRPCCRRGNAWPAVSSRTRNCLSGKEGRAGSATNGCPAGGAHGGHAEQALRPPRHADAREHQSLGSGRVILCKHMFAERIRLPPSPAFRGHQKTKMASPVLKNRGRKTVPFRGPSYRGGRRNEDRFPLFQKFRSNCGACSGDDRSPQASASWQWLSWSIAQLPAGKAALRLTMNQTTFRLFYNAIKGVIASEPIARAGFRGGAA